MRLSWYTSRTGHLRHLTIKGGMIGSVDYALLAVIIAARRVFSWLDVIVVNVKRSSHVS